MPTLVAVDVSVTDDRISLVFSHRAVAQAYAKHLALEDRRPPSLQPAPSYQRNARLNAAAKEVTLSLPSFVNWFITCRLPDDEDSITFTFADADDAAARRWADSMVLFESVVPAVGDDNDAPKQLHVRRLWNKSALLKRLEDVRRATPRRGPTPAPALQGPPTGAAPAPLPNGSVPHTSVPRTAAARQAQHMWWS
ncbi:hypothetical protein QBC47DRAFT_463200 [Echria macrotheca]|uniref:Uncharacterized protein n=1 Tax=Echria macrotheca TaxID=438768 RepID=A0AAJ0B6X5_9PEZI|nr:hypothetical protein QBC47DRAFT_463200 [Echria macrotheca]